ncbi:hypothetical protein [Actinophytocola oryzae]|uniref:Uncharacterized protein n=1 Tax=Actinophytocola oryzae TaxID=502181 RepID=A0A4R7VQV0_9PSEU|nr:hypothetical protein [Actinophytocola oryzae]TDV52140.1 hypothetical protein CLV71_105271 [Actinophytocola oryzae]
MSGWVLGIVIGLVVVVAVAALVTPIILLARRIAGQAPRINAALMKAEVNTAPLGALTTTIDHAETIVAGLARGRARLGG